VAELLQPATVLRCVCSNSYTESYKAIELSALVAEPLLRGTLCICDTHFTPGGTSNTLPVDSMQPSPPFHLPHEMKDAMMINMSRMLRSAHPIIEQHSLAPSFCCHSHLYLQVEHPVWQAGGLKPQSKQQMTSRTEYLSRSAPYPTFLQKLRHGFQIATCVISCRT
jgi:hypothetical protein